jgi:hypothetical protein
MAYGGPKPMPTITLNGKQHDYDAVVNLMDDELREELHSQGFETEQAFVDAYCEAHRAKFDEDFTVN